LKIERISRLRNHGIFRDFSWPSDLPDFKDKNLIYGWNGTGKTTLSNLFRSLQKQQDLNPSEGDVKFRIDGITLNGGDISTSTIPQARVFNRDSVDRSVFDIPNRKLPPVFFLGEDSVEKEIRILWLNKHLERVKSIQSRWRFEHSEAGEGFDSFCTNKAREIKNLLTTAGGGKYNNYNIRHFQDASKQLIEITPTPSQLSNEERRTCLEIKAGTPKEKIPLPVAQHPDFFAITEKVRQILKRSVVSATLTELLANPQAANWVSEGLPLHTGEDCLFCAQKLPSDRIEKLEANFNDQFREFQNEIAQLTADVETARELVSTLPVPDKGLLYRHLVSDYVKATATLKQQSSLVAMYFDSLIKALRVKKGEPFNTFDLDTVFMGLNKTGEKRSLLLDVLQLLSTVGSVISAKLGQNAYEAIKQLITRHNKYTDDFSSKVNDARADLERDSVIQALQEYQRKQVKITTTKEKLDRTYEVTRRIETEVSDLELAIKQCQKPADELNREMASYLGRDELRFEVQDNGYTITRNGKAAMKLSEGERSAIAFMYFLKSLEDTSFDIASGIIVIDDPVSSLDSNSIYHAYGFMKERTKKAGQLFILTHNYTLFQQVKKWFNYHKKREREYYMLDSSLIDNQRHAFIRGLDELLQNYESEYQYLFSLLYKYSNSEVSDLGSYYHLPNIARRLLESFLAFKQPKAKSDMGMDKRLDDVPIDEAKKARILRFTNTLSHSRYIEEGPGNDLSVLAETPAVLRDILLLMETMDKEHHDQLRELADSIHQGCST
jgi:wobble nucleotide-excising tRNase